MTFTGTGSPEAEARVAEDLAVIVDAVRSTPSPERLEAVLLLGGFARGEGAVVRDAGGVLRGFNDYDLLLVFSSRPRDSAPFQNLSHKLAERLAIEFVDLGVAGAADLAAAPPTLFWYELGLAHRVLWAAGEPPPVRRFPQSDLDPAEGSRLLVNRGMGLLWAALRLRPPEGGRTAPRDLEFSAIASHKAVLAAGDAALLRENAYALGARERLGAVRDRARGWPWAPEGFPEAYANAVRFRGAPAFGDEAEIRASWSLACGIHEAGLRAAETARLGSFESWEEHARRVRRKTRRWASPREAARALRRRLRGAPVLEVDDRCLADLPVLLYAPAAGDPGGEPPGGMDAATHRNWRERAAELVRLWHP